MSVAAPNLPAHAFPEQRIREDFDDSRLPLEFQWLRSPWPDELFSLTARPGHLRLYGRETIGSLFRQALVARRQQAHCFSAATVVEFEPEHFQQMAGLICYYNGAKFHYLYVSHDETLGKHLRVMSCLPDQVQSDAFTPPVAIPSGRRVQLRVEVDYERLRFGYRVEGSDWRWLPQQFDASILSDEATAPGWPTSPARSSAWPARTWRGRPARPTSTISSTRNGTIVRCSKSLAHEEKGRKQSHGVFATRLCVDRYRRCCWRVRLPGRSAWT